MAELTVLEEKIAEVIGLAMAAQDATEKVEGLTDDEELAQQLRQQPGAERIRMMALTGYGEVDAVQRAREAGFDRHLVKPVDPAILQGILARLQER